MAQHYVNAFTAANGTPLTSVGFDKVVGSSASGYDARVEGNKGACKTAATSDKQVYLSHGRPGERDYRTKVTVVWLSGTNSREGGIGDRITSNGKKGYFFLVDMAFGTPTCRLVRRVNDIETELDGGPKATAPTGAGHLTAGVTLSLECRTSASSVRLIAKIGSQVLFDFEDTSSARIEGGGGPGIWIGGNCQDSDILFDDLLAEDFEADAPSTAWQTGLAIILNGVYLDAQELASRGLSVVSAVNTFAVADVVGVIDDLNDAHEPALKAGDWVHVLHDGVHLCAGPIREVEQLFQIPEGIRYQILGPRTLSDEVPITDPVLGGGYLAFNQDEDSEWYRADRTDKTVGEMLAYLWDEHADGDDGLRVRGAAPASGAIYSNTNLSAMDCKIPHVTLTGTVTQAEETLFGYMPEFALFIDPETKVRHVRKRSTAATKEIDAQDHHVQAQINKKLRKARTVVLLRGGKPETVYDVIGWEPESPTPGGLTPSWHRDLDATITEEKRLRALGDTTVTSAGVDGSGWVYVELDTTGYSMDPHEWDGTVLVFEDGAQAGNSYDVRENGSTRVTLNRNTWIGGTPPAPGDRITIRGAENQGGSPNGYEAWAREFLLDQGIQVVPGSCIEAKITSRIEGVDRVTTTKFKTRIGNDGRQRVKLDLPAIGLINKAPDPCVEGAVPFADKVEIEGDFVRTDEHPDGPTMPLEKRVPAEGWYGPAFSADAALWGTGAVHHPGDPGVMTPHVIHDPNYVNEGLQGTEYQKYLDSVLAVLSNIPYEAQFNYEDEIDTSWAGLDFRVRFSDTGRTTGYETTDDLWILQVEWQFMEHKTVVTCGTLSAFGVDVEKARDRHAGKTRLDVLKRQIRLYEDLRNCAVENPKGAGGASGDGGLPSPDCNVSTAYHNGTSWDRARASDLRLMLRRCQIPDGGPLVGNVCAPPGCTITGANILANNAGKWAGKTVLDEKSAEFFNHVGGDITIGSAVVALICHVQDIWEFLHAWTGAVDTELMKGKADFDAVVAQFTALANCVYGNDLAICEAVTALQTCLNDRLAQIDACLATKQAGSSPPCGLLPCEVPCVVEGCVIDLSPEMCDPPECVVSPPDSCTPGGQC